MESILDRPQELSYRAHRDSILRLRQALNSKIPSLRDFDVYVTNYHERRNVACYSQIPVLPTPIVRLCTSCGIRMTGTSKDGGGKTDLLSTIHCGLLVCDFDSISDSGRRRECINKFFKRGPRNPQRMYLRQHVVVYAYGSVIYLYRHGCVLLIRDDHSNFHYLQDIFECKHHDVIASCFSGLVTSGRFKFHNLIPLECLPRYTVGTAFSRALVSYLDSKLRTMNGYMHMGILMYTIEHMFFSPLLESGPGLVPPCGCVARDVRDDLPIPIMYLPGHAARPVVASDFPENFPCFRYILSGDMMECDIVRDSLDPMRGFDELADQDDLQL